MKCLSDRDLHIVEMLEELAGGTGILDASMHALRARTRGTMQMRDLIAEIISRREPEVQAVLRADPRLARYFT